MASERLVSSTKYALEQHYKLRPQYTPTKPSGDDCEVWARGFTELLADYDFIVGGKRDEEVKAWVDDVENLLEPLARPSWISWGSRILRRFSSGSSEAKTQDPVNVPDLENWEDMRRYLAVPSWDYLVDTIHKVERNETGEIVVYFTSRHGEKIKETGKMCKVRLPKKLLAFYEENLRWNDNVVLAAH
ncbi:hypothetical protein JOM56_014573 [Amanita muscaria]